MWIIQEIVLATQWLLMAGSCIVSAVELVHFYEFTNAIEGQTVSQPSFIPEPLWRILALSPFRFPCLHMKKTYYSLREANRAERFKYITFFTDHRATDPRDKVFAFQSLVGNLVEVDYSKSTQNVYGEYAKEWVLCSHTLDLLCFSGRGLGPNHDPGIPSWVPNWHEISVFEDYKIGRVNVFHFTADRGLTDLPGSHHPSVTDHFVVNVFGSQFDGIAQVFPLCSLDQPGTFARIFKTLLRGRDPNGVPFLQIFLRCLS